MTVADRIKNRRIELDMTQDELALKMGYTGKSSISKIETSGDNITLKKIARIAPLLQTSTSYLMGWADDPNLHDDDKTTNINPNGLKKQIRSVDIFADIPPEEIEEAIKMYESYTKSLPQIQKAVDDLLKSSESDV